MAFAFDFFECRLRSAPLIMLWWFTCPMLVVGSVKSGVCYVYLRCILVACLVMSGALGWVGSGVGGGGGGGVSSSVRVQIRSAVDGGRD